MPLAALALAPKDLHDGCEAIRAGRNADLKRRGVSLDAIVVVGRRNGCLGVRTR